MKIDLNVDMGEGFGRYVVGNDEALMPYITSANVATGFHAGDPLIMEQTVLAAKRHNVAVGAHMGLFDRQGFGRRELDLTPEEMRTDVLYQIGALDAFLKIHGLEMQHVKPHGILYRMVFEYEKYIDVFLDTIKEYNSDLYIMLPRNAPAFKRGEAKGLNMAAEILVDLSYDDEGNWVLERRKEARSPQEVADRSLMVAKDKKIPTVSGKLIDADAHTLCVHGDAPNALEVVKTINEVLASNGITLGNLRS